MSRESMKELAREMTAVSCSSAESVSAEESERKILSIV
jgi:hypothetical protein